MVGQLKIVEFRDRARERLGERFDIHRFHRVVLDQCSVPLPVLENAVDAWIASSPQAGRDPGAVSGTAAPTRIGGPA